MCWVFGVYVLHPPDQKTLYFVHATVRLHSLYSILLIPPSLSFCLRIMKRGSRWECCYCCCWWYLLASLFFVEHVLFAIWRHWRALYLMQIGVVCREIAPSPVETIVNLSSWDDCQFVVDSCRWRGWKEDQDAVVGSWVSSKSDELCILKSPPWKVSLGDNKGWNWGPWVVLFSLSIFLPARLPHRILNRRKKIRNHQHSTRLTIVDIHHLVGDQNISMGRFGFGRHRDKDCFCQLADEIIWVIEAWGESSYSGWW